jgi:broad specificity phosphatase PhoE
VKVDGSVKVNDCDGNLAAMDSAVSTTLPTRLTLISHAVTQALRHAQFPVDESLLEGEKERIASIRWPAPRSQHVLCGSEKRTRQTAEALGLEATVLPELSDIDYGRWKGQRFDDIQASDPDGLSDWLSNPNAVPHGGDSLAQLIGRTESWMKDLIGRGHIIAVTHPAVIRASLLCALEIPAQSFWRIEISPFSQTDLRFSGQHWTIRSLGCSL